jgi:hypothetical protein
MGRVVLAAALFVFTTANLHAQGAKPLNVDVAVYGGNASGVIAALATAREGKSVILLEPGKHLGGMVSGGLGATDVGNALAIGGYSREFFDRVRDHYTTKYGPASQQVKDCSGGFRFEPHVAEEIFNDLLHKIRTPIHFGQRLDKVTMAGKKIASITMESGLTVNARVFIDASYEGDLMAKAKVSCTVGREGSEKYGESIAGVQKYSAAHQWPVKISPFVDGKKLLPLVQANPAGTAGSGDRKVQAYNFRLCMTQDPAQRLPWAKPATYDPVPYELLARYLAKRPDVKVGQLMNPVKVPNGKTDTNNNGPISTDHIGANWDYPEADYVSRDKIWHDHVNYQRGLLYFLANDPRVPAALQKEMNTWGLAKDEFKDTDHWPHQLYVREARRMVGAYVMTQKDIMDERTKDDSVGLGSYTTDSHHVQRVVGDDGFVINEGDFQVRVQPYAIAYRSLVPKASECTNLLVPLCCSASHVAYGTIRMEPVYMILGQASGLAATLAIDDNVSVQEVPIAKLQAKLKAQKAVLSPEGIASKASASVNRFDPSKLGGIVIDDEQAEKTGAWTHSTSAGPFVAAGYLHDNNEEQGKRKVRFTPKLSKAGTYDVRLFYATHSNRASNALVIVRHKGGDSAVRVNQRQAQPVKGLRLGLFDFEAGGEGWVEVRNDDANGYVIADAVQWVAQEK